MTTETNATNRGWKHISEEEADTLMPETGAGRSRWKTLGEAAQSGPVFVPASVGQTLVALQSNAASSLVRWWPRGTFTLAQARDGSGLIIRLNRKPASGEAKP